MGLVYWDPCPYQASSVGNYRPPLDCQKGTWPQQCVKMAFHRYLSDTNQSVSQEWPGAAGSYLGGGSKIPRNPSTLRAMIAIKAGVPHFSSFGTLSIDSRL